jgi:D-arabinitol dehydrogenase (NADP+)
VRAIVYPHPRNFSLEERPDPIPGPGEVRLRVQIAGLCGTDVHLHDGEFFPVYPLTPGHEIVGEVDLLGDDVSGLERGDLVALDNMISCGLCDSCRRARPAFCRTLRALGVTNPGGFADYVIAPAGKCHVTNGLPLETAVFAEPTACAIHGLDVLDARPGSDILLFGAGPSGMLLAQLLRHSGGARVTMAAPTAFKLQLARDYGIDETVLMNRGAPDETVVALRRIAPDGFDIVVDATGALAVLETCLGLTRDGGTLFVYGMAAGSASLPIHPYEIFRRELSIKGSFSQSFSFDRAMLALKTGRVLTDGLITHRFSLAEYGKAVDTVRDDHDCLKAVIAM